MDILGLGEGHHSANHRTCSRNEMVTVGLEGEEPRHCDWARKGTAVGKVLMGREGWRQAGISREASPGAAA